MGCSADSKFVNCPSHDDGDDDDDHDDDGVDDDDDNDDVLWVDPDPKCVNCPPPHRGSFENIFATTSAAADALLVPLGNQQDTNNFWSIF